MSIKAFIPGALVVVGLLFGGFPADAQDKEPVVILKPVEDGDLPAGSQISEERLQETQTKIQEFKAQQLRLQQQQQQAPQEALPKPEGEQN